MLIGLFGVWVYNSIGLDAERDDFAIEANTNLRPGEQKQRVGTAPWAYYGLGAAIIAMALLFAVPALF